MSEENAVNSMTTDEEKAIIESEVNRLEGKATVKPEVKPEPEVKQKVEDEATREVDSKPEVKPEGDDGENKGGEEGENPYRKRIDRLLRKRDTLQETLAEKEARIAQLEIDLKNRPPAENKKDDDDDEGEEKPKKDISKVINEVLDERENKNKSAEEKMKIREKEFSQLTKAIPNAGKRKEEVLELAEKYPTLTLEAIDRIIAPEDHIDPIEVNRKSAKRMDTSARSRADLETDKDMTKANVDEQEKYLREQQASGNLVL